MKHYIVSIKIEGVPMVFGVCGANPTDAVANIEYLRESTFTVLDICEITPRCAMSVLLA